MERSSTVIGFAELVDLPEWGIVGLRGKIDTGAKTSALLANLVFWELEWHVVADLHERGITYSRLIDDITCSSNTPLPKAELTRCIAAIRTMVQRKGLKLKRQKQTIARAQTRMVTTKLVVNKKTGLPAEQRSAFCARRR